MQKFLRTLMLAVLMLPFASQAQETVTIGEGTSTTYVTPFNSLWGYSFVEQIYLASEIGTDGNITAVRFYLSSGTQTNNITLYMKNVTRSTFSGTTDYEPVTAADIVFTGSVTFASGWVEIQLDQPFEYDGTSNLLVAMHESTSGYSTLYFNYTAATDRVISFHSDSYNPDPYNLGSYSGNKYTSPNRANIQLDIEPAGEVSCNPVRLLRVVETAGHTATLSWVDTNNTGSYDIYQITPSAVYDSILDTVLLTNTSDTTYTISNLDPDTTYRFGVAANCGADGSSNIRFINATTTVACPVPTNVSYTLTSEYSTVDVAWHDNNASAWELRYWTGTDTSEIIQLEDTAYSIENLLPNTNYKFQVRAVCGDEDGNSLWTPASGRSFTTPLACRVPIQLTAILDPTEPTTATITWVDTIASAWQVAFNGDTNNVIDVTETSISFDTLTPETTYTIMVRANCGDFLSPWTSALSFEPSAKTVIGTAQTTNSYLPAYSTYNYSLTQQIYTAAELGEAGMITSVDFKNVGSAQTRNIDVYMVYTEDSAFASTTSWITATTANLVFSGNVTFTAGVWTTITFDNPFFYNGTSNVALIVDDNTGSWESGPSFYVFNAPSQALYVYDDYTNFDPTNPSDASSDSEASLMNVKNYVRFLKTEAPECMPITMLTVLENTVLAHEATLTWEGESDSYLVEYKKATDSVWIEETASDTTITLTNLDPVTTYNVRVTAICGGENSTTSGVVSFTTPLACQTPANFVANIVPGSGNMAVVTWTDTIATAWQIALIHGTDTSYIDVTDTTGYTFDTLTAEETYNAMVRANCEDIEEGYSPWSPAKTFVPTDSYLITVADGTNTNDYVPVYGLYTDDYERCQTIYPANMLTPLVGGDITGLTYYLSSPASAAWTGTFTVKMMEVTDATLSGFNAAIVNEPELYTGTLDASGATMTITLSQPYTYAGGNLLIEVNETVEGNYKSASFYGMSATGASWQGYSSSSWASITGSAKNFIPKTTFSFEPGVITDCTRPDSLTVSDVDAHTATFDWQGDASEYLLQYKQADATNWTEVSNVSAPYTLTGLQQNTAYTARVKAICGNDTSMASFGVSFTTTISCPAPTNIQAILTPGDGTVATVTWTDTLGTAWQVCLVLDGDTSNINDVTDTTAFDFTELTPEAIYTVMVRSICDEASGDISEWVHGTFNPTSKVVVGTPATTNQYLPTNCFYKYSLTQQLYTAAELGSTPGAIMSVDFKCQTATTRNLDVYIVNTTSSTISSFVPVTSDDLVYSGNVSFTANEWTTITFDNPFIFDGQSNIILVVDDNTGSYTSTYYFSAFSASNQAIYVYNDNTNYNATAPSYSGTVSSTKNHVRFLLGEPPTCLPVRDFEVSEIGNHSAMLSWTERGEATSWQIMIDGDTTNAITVNVTEYVLTGLSSDSSYTVTVRAVCDDEDMGAWSNDITFNTLIACPTPTDLTADVMPTSADVTWNGFGNAYQLEYALIPENTDTNASNESIWLQYDNDTNSNNIGNGNGGTFTWGVMYPAAMLAGNSNLTKVAVYENSSYLTSPYTVNVYTGGTTAPGTLVATENVTPTGTSGIHEITLSNIANINPNDNLWVTVTATGTYIIAACEVTPVDPNSQWIEDGGTWANIGDLASSLSDYSWMVRAYVEPGFDEDQMTWTVVNNATSPYTINNLTPVTRYAVRVKANCGSDGESDYVYTTFTTDVTCPAVTLAVDSATENSITISWESIANNFSVYNGSNYVANTTANTYTFTGLDASTAYNFSVVALCSATDSSLAATINASTLCGTITVLPFIEEFAGSDLGCWTSEGDGNWTVGTGDYSTTTGAYSGNTNARITHTSEGDVTTLISPVFNFNTTEDSIQVSFAHVQRAWSNDIDEHRVLYRLSDTSAWIEVADYTTAITSWTVDSVIIPSDVYQIAFEYTDNYGYGVGIDKVIVSVPGVAPVVDSFTVTLNTTAGGTVSPMGSTIVAEGASFTATATADSGYHFVNWTNAAGAVINATNPYTFTVTANVTLTAHFEANGSQTNYYTVTVSSADTTMGTVSSTANGQVAENTSVTATATAKAGYHFVNWTNAAGAVINATNPYTFTVTSDVTLVANFEANGTTYVEATIDASEIQYWVGNGNNQAIVAVNWANAAYAWGVKFSEASITVQGALDIIKNNDPRFNYTLGDYGLDNITFDEGQTHLSGNSAWNQLLNNEYGSGLAQNVVNNDFVKWGENAAGIPIDSTYYQDWGWYYTYVFTMPIVPMWSYVGIQSIDMSNVYIYSVNSTIYVKGAEGQNIYIYDLNGRTIATKLNASETMAIPMAENGVYLVRVGNASAKRVIVMR